MFVLGTHEQLQVLLDLFFLNHNHWLVKAPQLVGQMYYIVFGGLRTFPNWDLCQDVFFLLNVSAVSVNPGILLIIIFFVSLCRRFSC